MINEAIILAGGLGTRLSGIITDIPKPMAPIAQKPFLAYLLEYVSQFNINKIILAVGFKYKVIENYFGSNYKNIRLIYAVENQPLGTGGAILNALQNTQSQNVFLLNGDTFFDVDLNMLEKKHTQTNAHLTLSLKPLTNFDRYGTVELDNTRVSAFIEKKNMASGLINGGVYALNKNIFDNNLPLKFSFETDVMEKNVATKNIQSIICNNYFIDIGIPTDYNRAITELPQLFNT